MKDQASAGRPTCGVVRTTRPPCAARCSRLGGQGGGRAPAAPSAAGGWARAPVAMAVAQRLQAAVQRVRRQLADHHHRQAAVRQQHLRQLLARLRIGVDLRWCRCAGCGRGAAAVRRTAASPAPRHGPGGGSTSFCSLRRRGRGHRRQQTGRRVGADVVHGDEVGRQLRRSAAAWPRPGGLRRTTRAGRRRCAGRCRWARCRGRHPGRRRSAWPATAARCRARPKAAVRSQRRRPAGGVRAGCRTLRGLEWGCSRPSAHGLWALAVAIKVYGPVCGLRLCVPTRGSRVCDVQQLARQSFVEWASATLQTPMNQHMRTLFPRPSSSSVPGLAGLAVALHAARDRTVVVLAKRELGRRRHGLGAGRHRRRARRRRQHRIPRARHAGCRRRAGRRAHRALHRRAQRAGGGMAGGAGRAVLGRPERARWACT